jgi:hypothetical protein
VSKKSKYVWENEGDVSAKLSQCSNCKHNKGITLCEVFVKKPDKYALNKKECPKYRKE